MFESKRNEGIRDDERMKDPVCGMDVASPPKHLSVRNGQEVGFCSTGCKAKFDAAPASYEAKPFSAPMSGRPDFTPLVLILSGIVALAAAKYFLTGQRGPMSAMHDFMGMFLVVFGGFKLLDVRGFADAYSTYDLVAKRSRAYALAYPFVELVLGACYLAGWRIDLVDPATFVLMLISGAGVLRALMQKKRIQCACLGTKIKLPMTQVTLLEDLLMAGMALWGILH